jgi:hypothetical protein
MDRGTTQDEVVELLRQASTALDRIWRQAMSIGAGDTVIRLGEASHGVHRAIIALSTPADVAAPRPRHGTAVSA